MRHLKTALLTLMLCMLVACTSEFAQQQANEMAGQARLIDSVEIKRSNERVLARQEQVCLVTDVSGESGAALLRTMQSAFTGYFAAVGVEDEPMDYLRAVATAACPGASYLFFVQPIGRAPCVGADAQACENPHRFIITIVSRGDQSLIDRVTLIAKQSFIPLDVSEQARLRKVFERLAARLTGASEP
jgi:hypothetical protein